MEFEKPSVHLTESDIQKLNYQDSRGLVSEFHQEKLEKEAKSNWDKFYKRNENRFFKDRNWTTREFQELVSYKQCSLLEVGCGVGNFFYPLLSGDIVSEVIACDFSQRAIDMVKSNALYNPDKVMAFECDIVKSELPEKMNGKMVDVISLVFVLSAILPKNFKTVLCDLLKILKPGGSLLFRDYGVNDMAMIRFGPGSKLSNKLYVRQDGTRAYYFELEELAKLFEDCGFSIKELRYVYRQTVNKKEGIDVKRVFVQARCQKAEV